MDGKKECARRYAACFLPPQRRRPHPRVGVAALRKVEVAPSPESRWTPGGGGYVMEKFLQIESGRTVAVERVNGASQ